jgi:crotonobetaine/carnitine-CoA ligase
MSLAPLEVLRRFRAHDFSLAGFLASRAEAAPDAALILFEGGTLSASTFAAQVEAAAAMLTERGIGAGDRLGVLSTNHPSTLVLLFACARLGAILVPANPDYGVEEAAYVFGNAGISGLVTAPATLAVAEAARDRLAPRPWLMLNEPLAGASIELLADALAGTRASPPPPVADGADRTCLLVYTSGTTGFPKGVMHGQRGIVLSGEAFVARMHLQPEDRLLCVLPLFHINALFYSVCGAIACGGSVAVARRFSASTFWRTAAETGATETNLMAAAAKILMLRPESEFVPGHRLRKAFIAPLTDEMIEAFTHRFGVPHLIEGYGMTEIPGALANPFDGERRRGSVGLISPHPDPSVPRPALRLVDDALEDVPDGTPGELLFRTPTLMQGYWNAPEATAAAFHEGWFRTGDLMLQEPDGYLRFIARKKDIIRRRGENISGAELDRVIGAHPAVAEVATIGVPSELGDEEVLAAVVLRPGMHATAGEIAEWVRGRLAAYKVPRFVAFMLGLPQTATQRIEKYRLRGDAALLAAAEDLAPPPETTRITTGKETVR